jgi:fused signal recognition particle receptor
MAHKAKSEGKSVILAAGDTFRAAAIEQLQTWAQRVGVEVVAHQPGADPGAVVYDAMAAAKSRQADLLIIDTAGRLHTKFNLMEELKKIKKITSKTDPTAPHEILLVLDATTGQNGLAQAKSFTEATGITSIFLSKLDGTAKGGIALAICDQLKIPVRYFGVGEHPEDIADFSAKSFVEALSGN